MSNRLVLLASLKDFEKFFGMQIDDAEELPARYNVSPGEQIPVILAGEQEAVLEEVIWGVAEGDSHLIGADKAVEGLEKGELERCIIPVSGYYKWKRDGKRSEYPFFIRMLDDPLMALGGVIFPADGDEPRRCAIVETSSNALIQPLDPLMPLQFDREFSSEWLREEMDIDDLVKEARQLFLMTDMTVLRVSDKVNDPSNNSPDLIQPLPK